MGAVFFGIGVIYKLGDRVEHIKIAEQSDPLWIASQLQFELLRLEKELSEFALGSKPAKEVEMRFDIAWSRINILQEGKLPQILKSYQISGDVLTDLEDTFRGLETEIKGLSADRMTGEDRRQKANKILLALEGYELLLRDFLIAVAQAKTGAMSEFRTGLLSLSNAIMYFSITILSLFGLFIFQLLLELKVAKKMENEMRILAQEATSASRLKMNFMSAVSHELRTPLTSILGGLALLRVRLENTLKDESALKLLNVASRNGDRLLALVNDILDAQALSEGKVSVERKPVDLNGIVTSAIENCHAYATELGVSYQVTTPQEKVEALTDSARVMQVLVNLLSNAAKFTSSGDVVKISVEKRDQTARIEITDNGMGIPADQQRDVFLPFHQINPGTTGAHKSSGLGLSITKQLIDLLGGDIGFNSIKGKGSTFWIELDLLQRSPDSSVEQSCSALADTVF